MAAMAVDAPQGPGSGPSNRLGVPSRNPLPLSASQEAQVRDVFHARVRRQCGPEIKGMGFLLPNPLGSLSFSPSSPYFAFMPLPDFPRRLFCLVLPTPLLTFPSSSSSLRRMRSWSYLFDTLRLPRTAPADEQLHEETLHAGGAGCGARRMVRGSIRTATGTGEEDTPQARARKVHPGVVEHARHGPRAAEEGDGEA